MKIMKIIEFTFLFNLVLAMLYGLNSTYHIYGWSQSATGTVMSFNWAGYAIAMIGAGIIAGLFGLYAQATASQVYAFFLSGGMLALTAVTMNMLSLPTEITALIGGMIGLLAFFAIGKILSGGELD